MTNLTQPKFLNWVIPLFWLGLFFIPFDSYEGISGLGEFKKEAAGLFFAASFLILFCVDVFNKKRLFFPYKDLLIQFVFVFLGWCVIIFFLNSPTIFESYLKQTTGFNRFFRQFISLIISAVVFPYLYWHVVNLINIKKVFKFIRLTFLLSLSIVSLYAFFEVLYIKKGIGFAYQVLRAFDYLPFVEFDVDSLQRISSVCYEPPSLGTYLIMVAGWMFSFMIDKKRIVNYIPAVLVVILTYFSGSRTALLVVFFQLFLFMFLYLDRQVFIKGMGVIFTTLIVFGTSFVVFFDDSAAYRDLKEKVESLDFASNLTRNVSNKSRFGIQFANLQVFLENPIIGVGFGQQAYHAIHHYPLWAVKDNPEFKVYYLNNTFRSFPPGYNIYLRLLAETGVIGFGIFISILVVAIKRIRSGLRKKENQTYYIILAVSFSGFILNWFQCDMFRIFGFWLALILLVKLKTYETE